MVDNIGGAEEAIRHLIDLGHRKIAFIGGPKNSAAMIDRLKGYENALVQNGFPLPKNQLKWGDLTPESGYTAATALLTQSDRPTAIFAGNDMMAFGSMHAARKLGLAVPDDVAVVGFDDVALCTFVQPTLTTVEIPRYGLGVGAMQMLIDLISGNTFDRVRWFKTRLMPRESTTNRKADGLDFTATGGKRRGHEVP
jgi:DNA-binding LacI/PurR family transcriptional regulator